MDNKNYNNDNNNTKKESSSTKYDQNKELLIKLLKEKLDTRILKLEKRHKFQSSLMKLTTDTIQNITEWSINANKQIKEKLKKDKEKIPKPNHSKSKKKDLMSQTSGKFTKTKTPLRMKCTKSFLVAEDAKTDISRNSKSNKNLTKITKTLGNRTKSFSFLNKDKKKNKSNTNNLNLVGNDILRRPSIISNKSSKSNKTTLTSKSKTPKPKKSVIKVSTKQNGIIPGRKKTPFKKRNINENSDTHSVNNIKNISRNQSKEQIIKINDNNKTAEDPHLLNMNKMESALQKDDDLLNNDDPLLISPITDLDFCHFRMSNNTINSEITENEKLHNFKIENNINDKLFKIICDYINLIDLIQFKNISKHFNKLFFVYIKNKLEEDKNYFVKKKINFDEKNIPPKLTLKDFVISKGSTKAIQLLNEPSLNHLFFEDSPANNDILIIYRLFFQLINHPYKYIPKDKNEDFWKNCKYYFSHEIKGKTGELLKKTLDENMINIEGDNLYKIYKLVCKDLNKIYPTYYSKTCGTTGLISFFIKDILDFVGISNDEKIQTRAYWTYIKIIESLDNKINHIKNLKNI